MKLKLMPFEQFWQHHAASSAGVMPFIRNYAKADKDTMENRRIAYREYEKQLRQHNKLADKDHS